MYLRKVGDRWKAEIEKQGVRRAKTFRTKAEARQWGERMEEQIVTRGEDVSFEVAIEKLYEDRWSQNRLLAFAAEVKATRLRDVLPSDVAEWRKRRSKEVAPSTIRRDANLYKVFFKRAKSEYSWVDVNPFDGVQMPTGGAPRHQRWHWTQIRRIVRNLGYRTGQPPENKSQQVAYAFLIALRTAMRASEVLTAELLDTVAVLGKTKTTKQGEQVKVPLRPAGIRLMKLAGKFTLTAQGMDALFRKAKHRCMIDGLTFHDSRGTALTMLARKVDILTLQRISRHKSMQMLSDVYYRETPEEISRRLAGK